MSRAHPAGSDRSERLATTLLRIPRGIRTRVNRTSRRQAKLRRRLQRRLGGSEVSIISSNCIGGRISALAGNPYRSPTVGLLFDADSFFAFVEDLPRFLVEPVLEDVGASEEAGYPVGRIGPVTMHFMHYRTFVDAEATWRERASRVDLDNVVLVYTDRSGPPDDEVARFAALPTARKVMFTAKEYPGVDCVVAVPAFAGEPHVGDLYTQWDLLEPVLKGARLDRFR